jgi:uncharacterized membrane protein YfcA
MNFDFTDILAIFICSAVSSMGLGGGGVLLLYLTLFRNIPQLTAQGLNLLFFLPVCVTSLIIYIKKGVIEFKAVLPVFSGSLAGVLLGRLLLSVTQPDYLKTVFAVFITAVGVFTLAGAIKKKN